MAVGGHRRGCLPQGYGKTLKKKKRPQNVKLDENYKPTDPKASTNSKHMEYDKKEHTHRKHIAENHVQREKSAKQPDRLHYAQLEWLKFIRPVLLENVAYLDLCHAASQTIQWCTHSEKELGSFLQNLNTYLSYAPHRRYLPRRKKRACVYKNVNTMFTAAFSVIAESR